MGLGEKVSSDVAVTTALKLSLKIRGLVLIPLLSIGIGVAAYGAFVQVQAIAILVANLCRLGTDQGFVQYLPVTDTPTRLYTALVSLVTVTGVLGAFAVGFAADLLAIYTLSEAGYAAVFTVAALYIPATVLLEFGRAYYRAHRRIKRFSIYEAIDVYLMIGGLTTAILAFDATVVQAFAVAVLTRVATIVFVFAGIAVDGGFAIPGVDTLRECLVFSIGTMGNLISQSLLDKTDRVLIGYFLGADAVGVYSAAYSVSYLMLLYFRPLSTSFFPEFSRLWSDDDYETVRHYAVTGIRYVIAMGLPSIAGFMLIGTDILEMLSTSEVAQAGTIPLVVLASAMLCKGLAEIYTNLFFAASDSRVPALIQGSSVGLNVILNVAMIPLFGVVGAAMASLLSFGAAMVVSILIFQRYLRMLPAWDHLVRIAVATLVMYGVFVAVSLPWLFILMLAPIVYATVLIGIGGLDYSEVKFVLKSIRP